MKTRTSLRLRQHLPDGTLSDNVTLPGFEVPASETNAPFCDHSPFFYGASSHRCVGRLATCTPLQHNTAETIGHRIAGGVQFTPRLRVPHNTCNMDPHLNECNHLVVVTYQGHTSALMSATTNERHGYSNGCHHSFWSRHNSSLSMQ